MTKRITKVIAALGVVAGLGIAALPLSSYAAERDVIVRFTIQGTIGSIDPNCGDGIGGNAPPFSATGPSGAHIDGTCTINGASNQAIEIYLNDKDANTSLVHTTIGTNTIPAIGATANYDDTYFIHDNIASMNAGAGGYGFRFVAGSATGGLAAIDTSSPGPGTNYANWNGVTFSTAPGVMIAKSTGATMMNATYIRFRAVTPVTQAPGIYENVVVMTIQTAP